ncbi:MAG: hypothetical protein IJW59_05055 [Clostridia bacterium]|nr:hypothetical protein [Clostridia bacterium]
MIAKRGMIMEMDNQQRFLVDDVKNINGVDYVVFYSLENKGFYIATEVVENKKPKYKFLEDAESIKIAEAIDKIDHNN